MTISSQVNDPCVQASESVEVLKIGQRACRCNNHRNIDLLREILVFH
jgi:hypothetical protein